MKPSASAKLATTINPATGAVVESFPYMDDRAIEAALGEADAAYAVWRRMQPSERAARFAALAAVLRQRRQMLAETMTREMGKPITQALGEVDKCAVTFEWYAEHGPAMLADETTPLDNAYISFLPIGLILAVTPWNFPIWQIVRGALPALIAGNGVVLKPAPNVVRSALNLADAFVEAGFPASILTIANLDIDSVPGVVADRRIAGVALTGSVRAGAAVASLAGRHVKKSVLELGGSDPFIVLADADLETAVNTAVVARFQNTGQVCIAAKRFIVEAPVAAEFTECFVEAAKALKIGDPTLADTYLGPMARADLRAELHGQLGRSLAAGARLLLGGRLDEDAPGWFYPPSVLDGVVPGFPAFEQETFGPMAAITTASNVEEAIALANRSDFGLSTSLWTRDLDRAKELARVIETGGVFINGYSATDARMPVGGTKNSGYGRELSYFGVREFTNAQTVVCKA